MRDLLSQLVSRFTDPDRFIRGRYRTFKELLELDRLCHRHLAELELLYYNGTAVDINYLRSLFTALSSAVGGLIACLNRLEPGRYKELSDYFRKFDFYSRFALAPLQKAESSGPYIAGMGDLQDDDLMVGGKGYHLYLLRSPLNLNVPPWFVLTTRSWNCFVEQNNLRTRIDRELARISTCSYEILKEVSKNLERIVAEAVMPPHIVEEIERAVEQLTEGSEEQLFAVRSSAVGEDSTLSFAGQYRSQLNVSAQEVVQACQLVYASKYRPEALLYRILNGLDDESLPMAAVVQRLIEAEVSGVMNVSGGGTEYPEACILHWVKGQGERLMAGQESAQSLDLALIAGGGDMALSGESTGMFSRPELCKLAKDGKRVAVYFETIQDIEWCRNPDGEIYMLQARNAHAAWTARTENKREEVRKDKASLLPLFSGGQTASPGAASGRVFFLDSMENLSDLPDGCILVCEVTSSALVAVFPRVKGVIVRYGSVADHFSSVAREFGIPVLVLAGEHVAELEQGKEISLNADQAEVYEGDVVFDSLPKSSGLLPSGSPVGKALKMVIDFCSPLRLTDPSSSAFKPQACRSLHDIIRFAHEKSIQAMFLQGSEAFFRKPKSSLLRSNIPMRFHIIDIDTFGSRPSVDQGPKPEIEAREIASLPFQSLWQGMNHPGINWGERQHFDWRTYDAVALAGGMGSKQDATLVSYCLVGSVYLNTNMRFGYHFTLLDCWCGNTAEENYVLLRFAGGGGSEHGQTLRLAFLIEVLKRLGFDCERTGNVMDARLMRYGREMTASCLEKVGTLLGSARLLDMYMKREDQVGEMVEAFFRGRFDFSPEAD